MIGRRPLGAALALVSGAWFAAFLLPLDPELRVAALDLLWLAVPAVAGAAAATAAFGPENRASRTSFLFLAAGALSWCAGQAIWTYHEVFGDGIPPASIADVAFIGALPLLAAAVVTWPRRSPRWAAGPVVDAAILTGLVFLWSFVFILGPILREPVTPLVLLNLAYPLGDVVLLAAVLFGIAVGAFAHGGRMLLLLPGFGALVIADTYYAHAGSSYVTGASVLDAGWTVGFAAVGACALTPPGWGRRLRLPAAAAPLGAIALLTAAAIRTILDERHQGWLHVLPGAVLFAVFVLLTLRHVAVAARLRRESSELRSLRRRLEAEYATREAALSASRTGVCMLDPGGAVTLRNQAWSALLRAQGREDGLASLVGGLAVSATLHGSGGARLRFWTEDERFLAVSSSLLPGGETLLTVDDVTDEEHERATRDRFLAEVVGAQDHEARRVAELLHDDVVQRLTALGLRLELAANRGGGDSLGELAREAGAVIASIRGLLVELHPVVLESQGLSAAVDAAAGSLRSLGVTVEVEPLDVRLAPEQEQLAYRLVQEALANALKHAHARRVEVEFSLAAGHLACTVTDDGNGFDPSLADGALRRGSLGLHLVRQRLELAGGRFTLSSTPAGGTSFGFELPVESAGPAPAREAALS